MQKWQFFAKNGQIFAEFGENLDFLQFHIILFMVPIISVIFSIIGTVLVKLWPKKYKNQLILDLKFPNKIKKTDQLQRTISREPAIILQRGLRRWNRNEKYFHLKSSHFFDPGPPLSPYGNHKDGAAIW